MRRRRLGTLSRSAALVALALGVSAHPAALAGNPSKDKAKPAKETIPERAKECGYRTPVHQHVVSEGEHLGLIAGRYGVLRDDLIEQNPSLADNPNLIRIGQTLNVCPEIMPTTSKSFDYTVESGDTLEKIANDHGMTVRELLAIQPEPVKDPNLIRVGQTFHIEMPAEILPGFRPEDLAAKKRNKPGKHPKLRQFATGPGYMIKRPYNAYGTPQTLGAISKAVDLYHRRADGGPDVRIGDISKKGGGKLGGHLSHKKGVDLDVGLIHKGEARDKERFTHATKENLDVRRTWLLLEAFLKTGHVRVIFLDYAVQKKLYNYAKGHGVSEDRLDEIFQYPRGRGRSHGIVRHWKSHKGHLHVRFKG